MVSISRELPVESEARLRQVLRDTDIEHLPGDWCFRRLTGAPPPEALATVRDADGWCALVPDGGGAAEPFGLTLSTFPPGIDNSGYIGWVSTTVKERTGSGVFVVCGDNPRRGGVFDYLGYPAEAADAVRAVLDDLRRPAPEDDGTGLDLRVFDVVETSGTGAISPATRFEFREREGRVEARYSGGAVDRGFLVGRREDDRVTTAYTQLDTAGRARTGTAVMRVTGDGDGRTLLIEDFTWSDGTTGRNVLRAAGWHRAR